MNGTMESMINDKIHPYRFPVDFAEFIYPNRSEILFDSVVSAMIVYTEIVIKAIQCLELFELHTEIKSYLNLKIR